MTDRKWYVGQRVIETDVNRKEPRELEVVRVGRKYLVAVDPRFLVRGFEYAIDDGYRNDNYRLSRVRTKDEYARDCEVASAQKELLALGFGLGISVKVRNKAPEILAAIKPILEEKP